MRGESHLYNPVTKNWDKSPKNVHVTNMRISKGKIRVNLNAHHRRTVNPDYQRVPGISATCRVNGKLIRVRGRTCYSKLLDLEIYGESRYPIFGIEKAVAIRAVRKAVTKKYNLKYWHTYMGWI